MGIEWVEYGLAGLFLGSFLSATILPLPSEAMLIGTLALGFSPVPVLLVATTGNFLGGLTNYWIGFKANNQRVLRRFNINEEKIHSWEKRSSKWGYWLGLLSWLPFLGDPMVIVLGFLKVRFWPLSLMMLIGKFLRYLFLVLFYLGFWT